MNLQNLYHVRKKLGSDIIKTIIFVGGATATGKSTLAKELTKNIDNSINYRRYQGFYDIAKIKNIPEDKIFEKVEPEQVNDWFVEICKNSEITISDTHYAVQMNRNITQDINEFDIYQEYVPTISNDLLIKLVTEDIKVIAILLECSPEQCINRELSRSKEKKVRNISYEDAIMENIAEEKEWKRIVSTGLVEGIKLNSEIYSIDELVKQCLTNLKSKEKKLINRKNSV